MARTVEVRGDTAAYRIRQAVQSTRLTWRGFEQPGSQRAPEMVAADQRKLYEDPDVVETVVGVMAFYEQHPIDADVLKTHDTYWFRQTYTRTTSKPASLGAVTVALLVLGYTLRGDRHEKTQYAAFYAPGKRPREAVPTEESVSWGEYKDAAIKKAEQRRRKKEKDAAQQELDEALRQREILDAKIRSLHKTVHWKPPSKVERMDAASSEQYLMRTHWDMVGAREFTNRDGLAHLDAWLCRNARDTVPVAESAREGWTVGVPAPHVAAAALGKDTSNVRKLYRALETLGRLEIEGNFRVCHLVTWRVGHELFAPMMSDKEIEKESAALAAGSESVPAAVDEDGAIPAGTGWPSIPTTVFSSQN